MVKEAFYIATTGRPGPVLIDLPKDVDDAQGRICLARYGQDEELQARLRGQPVHDNAGCAYDLKGQETGDYRGGGVVLSGASKELKELAEHAELPVTMTLMGLGGFPGAHKLSLGMLGMHGYYANKAVQDSDLLIAIGMRFDDRVTG